MEIMVLVCVGGYQRYPRSGTVYITCKPESGILVYVSTSRSYIKEYVPMYKLSLCVNTYY